MYVHLCIHVCSVCVVRYASRRFFCFGAEEASAVVGEGYGCMHHTGVYLRVAFFGLCEVAFNFLHLEVRFAFLSCLVSTQSDCTFVCVCSCRYRSAWARTSSRKEETVKGARERERQTGLRKSFVPEARIPKTRLLSNSWVSTCRLRSSSFFRLCL